MLWPSLLTQVDMAQAPPIRGGMPVVLARLSCIRFCAAFPSFPLPLFVSVILHSSPRFFASLLAVFLFFASSDMARRCALFGMLVGALAQEPQDGYSREQLQPLTNFRYCGFAAFLNKFCIAPE